MQQDTISLAPFYNGWDRYQKLLADTVAPLSADQLALQAAPSLRPAWLLTAHIIGTRVGWFHLMLGEGDPSTADFDPWDQDGAPPRTGAELARGLSETWQMIDDCLNRWTPATLNDPFTSRRGHKLTRQWGIWHVIEHDLHHGGELFLTLGSHGVPVPGL